MRGQIKNDVGDIKKDNIVDIVRSFHDTYGFFYVISLDGHEHIVSSSQIEVVNEDEEVVQYKGYAFRLKRRWYWPFSKYWVKMGVATGKEAPSSRN